MKKLSLYITLYMAFSICAVNAQQVFFPGYVVLNSGDTLHGSIQDRRMGTFNNEVYRRIKFRSKKKRARYSAYQIKAYMVENTIFESHWLNDNEIFTLLFNSSTPSGYGSGTKTFLRLDYKGEKVSIYYNEFTDEDGHFDGYELFKRHDINQFARATQGIFGVKKKLVARYFSDCPQLTERVLSGEFKIPMNIAKYYNKECSKTSQK